MLGSCGHELPIRTLDNTPVDCPLVGSLDQRLLIVREVGCAHQVLPMTRLRGLNGHTRGARQGVVHGHRVAPHHDAVPHSVKRSDCTAHLVPELRAPEEHRACGRQTYGSLGNHGVIPTRGHTPPAGDLPAFAHRAGLIGARSDRYEPLFRRVRISCGGVTNKAKRSFLAPAVDLILFRHGTGVL